MKPFGWGSTHPTTIHKDPLLIVAKIIIWSQVFFRNGRCILSTSVLNSPIQTPWDSHSIPGHSWIRNKPSTQSSKTFDVTSLKRLVRRPSSGNLSTPRPATFSTLKSLPWTLSYSQFIDLFTEILRFNVDNLKWTWECLSHCWCTDESSGPTGGGVWL